MGAIQGPVTDPEGLVLPVFGGKEEFAVRRHEVLHGQRRVGLHLLAQHVEPQPHLFKGCGIIDKIEKSAEIELE